MKITMLGGAGMMGKGIIRDLLSERALIRIDELLVPDSSAQRLEELQREFGTDPRLRLSQLDVTDAAALQACLVGADLCINSVPTLAGHQMLIFEAALNSRVHYIDLGGLGVYTVRQLEWRERFRETGVCAVLGVGGDPGMSNVICRAVADELDEIDSINLYWAAELLGPENPVLVPPYSVSTVLAEYSRPSTQFLDGRHGSCAPLGGRETLELPQPWGSCEFMYSPHSEPLTVPLATGIREKGIREFTWKLHLPQREHEVWVGLVKAGFGDFDEPVTVGAATVKPLDVLNAVICRNIARNKERIPAQEGHDIHFAIGRGRKQGVPTTARCEVIVRPNALYEGYLDAATSMNASIAAQLLLAGDRPPGVFAPEEFIDIPSYFHELAKRHFIVNRRVTTE